ncbi:hypothetical protein PWG71_17100 [Nocardiopsis sp. N85]|nr:hypothetical protein [Nocardiopsis sp. N85]MDE3723111.1 hypothetical protein [Nocardiopsis sp. N85]
MRVHPTSSDERRGFEWFLDEAHHLGPRRWSPWVRLATALTRWALTGR